MYCQAVIDQKTTTRVVRSRIILVLVLLLGGGIADLALAQAQIDVVQVPDDVVQVPDDEVVQVPDEVVQVPSRAQFFDCLLYTSPSPRDRG